MSMSLADQDVSQPTYVIVPPSPSSVDPSRTITVSDIVARAAEAVDSIRYSVRVVAGDLADTSATAERLARGLAETQLRGAAQQLAKQSARSLLEGLAEQGFAWRDVARLLDVSVPALRRWRHGERPTGAHLQRLATLVAFIAKLKDAHEVTDPATWLEIPLVPNFPVSGLDLAAAGRYPELLDVAAGRAFPEDVLGMWQPDWRERYSSDFEVFEAGDGELSLSLTPRSEE